MQEPASTDGRSDRSGPQPNDLSDRSPSRAGSSSDVRDLTRLKWATMILPVAFVWGFELVRFFILDPSLTGDEGHVAAAMIMGAAIVVFAMIVSLYLDRTQKQMVAQNKDLTVTHAVSSAVRGGQSLPELLDQALDRLLAETGALAGVVSIRTSEDGGLDVQRPMSLAPGLAWLSPILSERPDLGPGGIRYSTRGGLDTQLLDLALSRGGEHLGHLRLAFHPPIEPDISDAALLDIAGEIAGAAQLRMTVTDLNRREREREALYEVALQLTHRADLAAMLDVITGHARELLGAERAVVCLSGRGQDVRPGVSRDVSSLSLEAGCDVAEAITSANHAHNPICPLVSGEHGGSWAVRPLRGPDGVLGELCVTRRGHPLASSEQHLLGALADMAAIAVRTARLHEAEEQWTIHAERDRIARELHDSLAQVLGVIHLQLRALELRAKDEASHTMAGELSQLAETADEAYQDVREAILGLRETIREDGGLEGSLREYLRKYSRQTGIATSLTCDGDTRRALSPRAEVQLLRVVQEALTNTRKHSHAKHASVEIECNGPSTRLVIEDNGVGFDPARVAASMEGGFGLASMRERVEGIGGTLTVHTAPDEGTRILVQLEAEDARGTPTPQAQDLAG
jgi:signal transduction histidine kinase